MAALTVAASYGATNTFQAGSSWDAGVDWSSGNIPASTDALLISQTAYGSILPNLTLDNSFLFQTLSFDTGTENVLLDANVSGTTSQTLNFGGGTNALGGSAAVELSPATTGTVSLGTTSGAGNLTLSFSNTATIDVANSAATLVLGPNTIVAGPNGLTESGSGMLIFAGNSSYTGNTNISGGTLQITGTINTPYYIITISGAAANTPVAILGNGGSISDANTIVGASGVGSFSQTGGSLFASIVYVGEYATGNGTYKLSGGFLGGSPNIGFLDNYDEIGLGGTGNFIQTGGTNAVYSVRLGIPAKSRGTYNLDGGLLQAVLISGSSGTSVFNFNGGTLEPLGATIMTGITTAAVQEYGAIINTTGVSTTIAVGLVHDPTAGAPPIDGGLTVYGSGDLTLTKANTYTGPTMVNSGTLTLAQGGSIASPAVTVGSSNFAATLQINGNYTIGSGGTSSVTLSANTGNLSMTDGVIGTLTIGGAGSTPGLILNGGDSIAVDVSGTAADCIVLRASRTVSVSGTTTIVPTLLSPASGSSTLIIAPGGGLGVGGTFVLANPGFNYVGIQNLINTGTSLNLVSQFNPVPATAYFTGQFDSTWGTISGTGTNGLVNFSTDSAGLDNASQLPFSTTNVHFYASNTPSGALATTLGRNFTINSLTLDGTAGGGTQPVSIAGNTLTIEGTGGNGITLNPGAGALSISSAIALGDAQSWTNNSTNPLTLSGTLSTNSYPLTIAGSGTTVITSPMVTTGTASLLYAGTGTLNWGNTPSGFSTEYYLSINSGTLLISGTVSSAPSNLTVGGTGSISPVATIGGGASWSQSGIYVGVDSIGTFDQTGGTVTSYPLSVGGGAGSSGTYMLSSGTLNSESILVGDGSGGIGRIFQSGGVVNQGTYYVEIGYTGNGQYKMSGGLLNASDIRLGDGGGEGTFIQTGGTNATAELDFFPGGTYSLDGGLFQLAATSEYSGTFNFNGGVLQATQSNPFWMQNVADVNVQAKGAIVDTNGFAISISAPLLHDLTAGAPPVDGGLQKIGLGTLTLTASNTYTGPTQVLAGTLTLLNSSFGSGPVTVGGGGTLQLSDGNYSIASSLTLAPNSTLSMVDGELNNLIITGSGQSLSLTGNATIDLEVSGSLSDSILLAPSAIANVTGTNQINLNYFSSTNGTNILIAAPGGGLNAGGQFVLANPSITLAGSTLNFLGFRNLVNTGTSLALVTQINAIPASAWFTGTLGTNWSASTGSGQNDLVNFSSDSAGLVNAGQFPFASTNVHLYSSNFNLANLATTLGEDFTVNSVTVDGTENGQAGQSTSISGNTLTLEGTGGTGMDLKPGAGSLTITSAIALGGTQTWTNNSSNTLTISGSSVTGAYPLTVSGTGATILSTSLSVSGLNLAGPGTLTFAGVVTTPINITATGGTLSITGTISTESNNLSIDNAAANLTGNGFLGFAYTYVGISGSGSFYQSGGTHDVSILYLGYNANSAGTYVLSSGTFYNFLNFDYIGYSGTGTFIQSGGIAQDTLPDLGEYASGNGTYILNGGNIESAQTTVGDQGTGNFIQNGGSNSGAIFIGVLNGSHGMYSLNGGTLSAIVLGQLSAGQAGTSTFNFNGGTLLAPDANATLLGELTVANVQAGGAIINTNGFADTIPQPLLHDTTAGAPALDGGLTKSGSGTLTLSASNTYTGPTTVLSGTLAVTGTLASTAYSNVATGATMEVDGLTNPSASSTVSGILRGNGSVGSIAVTSGGILAPGLNLITGSAGALTANGNLTFADSTSIFSIRLGVAKSSDYDQLLLDSGNVSLNGADLLLALGAAYSTTPLGTIDIIIDGQTADSAISGEFAQENSIFAPDGEIFQIVYGANPTNTAPGNDVLLVAGPASVPEPSTWALGIAGAAAIFAMRRRSDQTR